MTNAGHLVHNQKAVVGTMGAGAYARRDIYIAHWSQTLCSRMQATTGLTMPMIWIHGMLGRCKSALPVPAQLKKQNNAQSKARW